MRYVNLINYIVTNEAVKRHYFFNEANKFKDKDCGVDLIDYTYFISRFNLDINIGINKAEILIN